MQKSYFLDSIAVIYLQMLRVYTLHYLDELVYLLRETICILILKIVISSHTTQCDKFIALSVRHVKLKNNNSTAIITKTLSIFLFMPEEENY